VTPLTLLTISIISSLCTETTAQTTRKRLVGTPAAPVQGGFGDRSNKNTTTRALSNKIGEKW